MAIPSAPASSPAMAAGRGSPNPMPAGLSALLKPDSTPRGMPSGSIQQIMNTARKMSDSQLADVLAGKSIDVPQYVAMTEAMGRKKLRTAMQGAQAQAQLQQPSVKDKLLAEEAVSPMMGQPMQGQMPVMAAEGGLASLPAPNMDTVDMADGGIIAFNGEKNEQLVPGFAEDFLNLPKGTSKKREETEQERLMREYYERNANKDLRTPFQQLKDYVGKIQTATSPQVASYSGLPPPDVKVAPRTPEQLSELQRESTRGIRAPLANLPAAAPAAAPAVAAAPAAAPAASASQADSGMGSLKSYMDAIKANQQDYYSKLEGLGAKQREGLAQLRRQGGGEALMNLAQGILSKPGLAAGIAAGLPGVTQTAAASRKEQRAVESLANEYDMNLAKARAADAKGNTDAALKFMDLANTAKYRADALNIERMNAGTAAARLNQLPESVRTAEYLKANPEMARYFPNIGKQERISMDKALEQWTKAQSDISARKQLEAQGIYSVMDLYNALNLGSVQSATIPGQGAPIIGKL